MNRMRVWCLGTLVLALLLLIPCYGAEQWTAVRSRNFLLLGNAREKTIREAAQHLEQFRAAFEMMLAETTINSPVPTVVVVFKDDKSFEPFKPVNQGKTEPVAGYFQGGEDVNYILLASGSQHANPYHVIFHEFVHQMVSTVMDDPPVWFNEGLAEYYSTFEVEGNARKMWLGKPIADHIRLLRQTSLMPTASLLTSDYRSFAINERLRRGIFYAQSWAFVHYLLLGNKGQRREPFLKFLSEIGNENDEEDEPVRLFLRHMGTDLKTIENELQAYIRQQSYPVQSLELQERFVFDSALASWPLKEADRAYYLGDLLLHSNRLMEAESYLRQALILQPRHADARASLGILHIRQNRLAEARGELAEAVTNEQVKPIAHYYYARSLLQDESGVIRSDDQEEKSQVVLHHLNKAIELMPAFADSYNLLGFMSLAGDEQLDESIRLVQHGIQLAPRRRGYLLTLAQLQLRKGDYEGAKRTAQALLHGRLDEYLRDQAANLLEQIELTEDLERGLGSEESENEAGSIGEERGTAQSRPSEAPFPRAMRASPREPIVPGFPAESAGAPPGAVMVTSVPDCAPSFMNVVGRKRVAGWLIGVETAGASVAFLVETGGKTYGFLAPAPGEPALYSCSFQLGQDFDFTRLNHEVVVYFDPPPATSPYAGRAVAIQIVSLEAAR